MNAGIAFGLSAVLALAIYGAVYVLAGGLALLAMLAVLSGLATVVAYHLGA